MRYNFGMSTQSPLAPLVRQFYRHFYNRFAFTYDPVSTLVSRGEWRAWIRAVIPFIRKQGRVLEIAFGTGNLLVDLFDAGLTPVGVDLSPYMIEITRRKLRARGISLPLLRAAVQQLPFPTAYFSSIVMTFPPGFVTDPRAMKEIRRVLGGDGSLIWADAPYLYPRDVWSRFLNWAYSVTGGTPGPGANGPTRSALDIDHARASASSIDDFLPREGWNWNVQKIEHRSSHVHVIIGTKLEREKD
jgi:SAM-dependent methyltransferase